MIAILADIHGNLPALEAVLDDLPQKVSALWVLGDMVGELPYPCQVLDRLSGMAERVPVRMIAGNREESLLEAKDGLHPDWWTGTQLRLLAWTADALEDRHWALLRGLTPTLAVDDMPGGGLLYHGSPQDVRGAIFTEADAERALTGTVQRWLAGGHNHRTRLFRIGGRCLLSAGSVGIGLEKVGGVASYVLLDENADPSGGRGIAFRRATYDVDRVARDMGRTGLCALAPGISRAVLSEVRTGRDYVAGLIGFASRHAEQALGHPVEEVPQDLWREAEELWDGAEWTPPGR